MSCVNRIKIKPQSQRPHILKDEGMKENKNINEDFYIQEYECGQKGNSYRMNKHQYSIDLSINKKKSTISLSSIFRAFFYPDNYPLGN